MPTSNCGQPKHLADLHCWSLQYFLQFSETMVWVRLNTYSFNFTLQSTKPIESSVLSSSDLSVAADTTLHSLGSKAWLSLYFFDFPYWHGFLAPFLYWMGVYPFENLSKAMNLYVTQATLWVTPGHWNLSSNALSEFDLQDSLCRERTNSELFSGPYIHSRYIPHPRHAK